MGKLSKVLKKVFRVYRERGMKGVIDSIDTNCSKISVYDIYGYTLEQEIIPLNEAEEAEMQGKKVVNWIIPDLSVSSGGHMTIFRFISNLEKLGIHNRIYLFDSKRFQDDEEFRTFLKTYYDESLTNDDVEIYNDVNHLKYAQVTMATGWQTAYFVRRIQNTKEKFYFVQDFEPSFYAMGSEYLLAENTYKFGFKGITAGDWLKEKLNKEYGMETSSFHFSYEKKYFKPIEKRDNKNRLFFYARPVTPRRAFELGYLALLELYKRMPDIEVIFAGWDISNYEIPFIHLNAGSIRMEELADCYAQCDLCLVMSTSNLSLMPLEIMASNSVVVSSYGANNEWFLNDENAILTSYDPVEIADTMEYYLKNKDKLEEKRRKGMEAVKDTDWGKEAEKVYEFLCRYI